MKRLIKTTIAISVTIIFISLMGGCTKTTTKNPSLSDIETTMKQKIGFKDMVKLDDNKLQKLYGLNNSELEGSFCSSRFQSTCGCSPGHATASCRSHSGWSV